MYIRYNPSEIFSCGVYPLDWTELLSRVGLWGNNQDSNYLKLVAEIQEEKNNLSQFSEFRSPWITKEINYKVS